MGMKTRRANFKKNSTWRERNAVDRRSTIGLGLLNVNGWSTVSENDVTQATLTENLDIFSIVETKKKPGSKKITLDGFKVFETRRRGEGLEGAPSREGGGIACAVKLTAGVTFSHYEPNIKNPELNYVSAERIWVKYNSEHGKTAICTVYCGFQSQDNRHYQWNEGIYSVLNDEVRLLRGQGFRVVLQGDFNGWVGQDVAQGGIPGNREKVTPNGKLLLDFIKLNNLINVNGATKIVDGVTKSICKGLWTRHANDYVSSSVLDYVLVTAEHIETAKEMTIDQEGRLGGGSDHNILTSRWLDKFISIPKVQPTRKPGWNIDGANWPKFRSVIQRDIDDLKIETRNIDSLSGALTSLLTKGLNSAAGKKTMAPTKPKLYPRHIVALLKERKTLERVFKTEKSKFAGSIDEQVSTDSLVIAKDNLDAKTAELNDAKSRFEGQRRGPLMNIAKSKNKRDRRRFWEYVKRKTKKSLSFPPLQSKASGILLHNPQEIADEVFLYLKDIFSGSDAPFAPDSQAATISSERHGASSLLEVGPARDPAPSAPDSQAATTSSEHPSAASRLELGPSREPTLPQCSSQASTISSGPTLQPYLPDHGRPVDTNNIASSQAATSIQTNNADDNPPSQFDAPRLPPFPQANARDHDYCVDPNPVLKQSSSNGSPNEDPNGFLESDFSVEEVSAMIKTLGNNKAAGHDDLVNEALKEAPPAFIQLLTKLYNMVRTRGKIPQAWKRGRIVLIHKKGPESDVYNYRPLTVIPCMCGTYSKLMNARLTRVVERHKLLGEVQNGFRKDRSGIDSAFILNSVLWKSMAKKRKVNLAFLDLEKAYDSVCRKTLWEKMANMGFGDQFLDSIKCLYDGDYVTSDVNGVTTNPLYLGRGLRQGCSLSPMLFAIYVRDMSNDLHGSNLGVQLHKVCVSCLFFADDVVLIARDADGLRLLLTIVQNHCKKMDMRLSIKKSKVMSSTQDLWELFDGDTVVGTLDKVLQYKYLGVSMKLNPRKSALVMMERARSSANSYKKACMSLDYDGPDAVDLSLSLWLNVAMPSILYGCEVVPFSQAAITDIDRHQSALGKFTLGLPPCAPNISSSTVLGMPSFKEQLYSAQLRYLTRLLQQDDRRWSKDAFLDHLLGDWTSPYLKYMGDIQYELKLVKWPSSVGEVKVATESHFNEVNNCAIENLSLPTLRPLNKRMRMRHVNESRESQVCNFECFVIYATNLPTH